MVNDTENAYAAQLQQARSMDTERQKGNKQQQGAQSAAENPGWRPDASKKYNIDSMQALLMIAVALIVDAVSFVLNIFLITAPLNWFVWLYALIGFYIWLKVLGISWSEAKGKRALVMFGAATGIEFIPFLSALPAWTAFVIGAVINDRLSSVEDMKEGKTGDTKKDESTDDNKK